MALVIHNRYHINYDINLVTCTDNIYIECTFLREGYIAHDFYRRVLFCPDAILIYIWKIKSNIVGSQLHQSLLDQYEDTQI